MSIISCDTPVGMGDLTTTPSWISIVCDFGGMGRLAACAPDVTSF